MLAADAELDVRALRPARILPAHGPVVRRALQEQRVRVRRARPEWAPHLAEDPGRLGARPAPPTSP